MVKERLNRWLSGKEIAGASFFLEGMHNGTCKDTISALCFQHGVLPGKVFHERRQIRVIKGT